LAAGLAVAGFVSIAAADVPWTNANGSNSVIYWENGRSDNGLFGSPTVIGDTFFFLENDNFEAQGAEGSNQITTDSLRVTVGAQGNRMFTEVRFASYGDYTLFGSGSSVDVTGSMTVTDALDNSRVAADGFHTTPSFPVFGNDTDVVYNTWTGYSLIDLTAFTGGPWTKIDLVFTNSLIVITAPGSNAAIATLPNTEGGFSLTIVPAPGSIALLGLGAIAGLRRRR
jgi:hypothetical protein